MSTDSPTGGFRSLALIGLDYMLDVHASVLVLVDPSKVSGLPDDLRAMTDVVLRLGRDLSPPMNIVVDDATVSARVAFDGVECDVAIPYSAILGAMPDEESVYDQPPEAAEAPRRPRLTLV